MKLWYRRGRSFVAVERNLLVAKWHGPPELPQLAALADAARAVGADRPGGGALFSVVAEVRGAPPIRLGAASLRALALPRGPHRGAAHVVLPRGLVGAGVRSVLGTMGAMGSALGPSETFDALEPAATWLADRLAGEAERWTAVEVLASYHEAVSRSSD